MYGRYLDLHANHAAYSNIKHIKKRFTYLQYLEALMHVSTGILHSELTRESRLTKDYERSGPSLLYTT